MTYSPVPQSMYTVVGEPELMVKPRLGPCAVKEICAVRACMGLGSAVFPCVTAFWVLPAASDSLTEGRELTGDR